MSVLKATIFGESCGLESSLRLLLAKDARNGVLFINIEVASGHFRAVNVTILRIDMFTRDLKPGLLGIHDRIGDEAGHLTRVVVVNAPDASLVAPYVRARLLRDAVSWVA